MYQDISDFTPAVFAVKNEYQIMLPVRTNCTFWVKVGKKEYYDDSNGILKSSVPVHRVAVPAKDLDRAKSYTVFWQTVEERKPYYPKMQPVESATFRFVPVPAENIRIYQIADAHGLGNESIAAAKYYMEEKGGLDLLILNGDVVDHSGDCANFLIYYQIATALTGGSIPVVVSRGNHDLRGAAAELLADYTPGENKNSYYTFRVGGLWGILLDCGEDKNDDHPEYGNANRCHAFRQRENGYFRDVLKHARREFDAAGVKHRIVVSHVPFTHVDHDPFNIEQPLYKSWVEALNQKVHPELMLCGHIHEQFTVLPTDAYNDFGAAFPVAVGSKIVYKDRYYAGCGILLTEHAAEITFNDAEKILECKTLAL